MRTIREWLLAFGCVLAAVALLSALGVNGSAQRVIATVLSIAAVVVTARRLGRPWL